MDKLKMQSPDAMVGNVAKIAALFPQCVTERMGKDGHPELAVDFDKLREELSADALEPGEERYQFTWPDKKASGRLANTPSTMILRPCREESVNFDTTQNLYIEGDNLEVLKILREDYLGAVKMIYIDPPYNTGNDFVYNDNFTQGRDEYEAGNGAFDAEGNQMLDPMQRNTEANGRFHTDWLNMIYPRLKVARELLSEDGVIFISIDDGELENLRRVCNEIFGVDNFRNTLLVRRRIKSLNSQFADNGLASLNVGFEYILVYSKTSDFLMKALRQKKVDASPKGRWDVFWSNADRPTMRYELLGFTPQTGQWRNGKDKAEKAVENYKVFEEQYSKNMTIEEYSQKTGITEFIRRIPNATGKNGGVQHWVAPSDTALRTSNWTDIEVSQISKEIDLPFDNPKSRQLITELIKLSEFTTTDIVLDFFSGSATTAHAVMKLNAEDGGHRKFIMVQLPESCDEKSEAYKAGYKNICEIGKERIRRAGDKIKSESPMTTQDLDIGFRVLKLDDTNMKDVYYAPDDYDQGMLAGLESNIKDDRTDLDLLFGCLIDWGLPLSLPYNSEQIDGCTVHTYNDGDLIACFDTNIPESVVKEIAKRKPLRAVFRDSGFASSPEKINVFEIFKLYMPEDANDISKRVRVI